MSTLYNLEPQATAKVLLHTTGGDILLELFAKQTPLTSRNFLQLCIDGYYDGTSFHRLVPGFIIQGGDPTGTGVGGEAIYDGGLFADEFHSRLKFNRRGLLGMANSGKKDDNGSQFFLTLGVTTELQGKNTMFGRVIGDTLYNLIKMGEADLMGSMGSDRPMYPAKITRIEILVNPFEDMVPRERVVKTDGREEKTRAPKKIKKKAVNSLLSFEDEEDQNIRESPPVKKTKFNTKLISTPLATNGAISTVQEGIAKSRNTSTSVKQKTTMSVSPLPKLNADPETQLPLPNNERTSRSLSSSPEPANVVKVSSLLERTNAQIAELKASMKRNIPSAAAESERKKSAIEQMIPANAVRGRKRKHGLKVETAGDIQALKILNAFKEKLDNIPRDAEDLGADISEGENAPLPLHANDDAGDDESMLCDLHFIANCQSCQSWDNRLSNAAAVGEDDDEGWMAHQLNFDKDRLGKDLTWKRKNEEELVVIDPREKTKDIKEEQKTVRLARKGITGKAWDIDRDRGRLPERMAGERQ